MAAGGTYLTNYQPPERGSGSAFPDAGVEPLLHLGDPLAQRHGLLPRDQVQAAHDARPEACRLRRKRCEDAGPPRGEVAEPRAALAEARREAPGGGARMKVFV